MEIYEFLDVITSAGKGVVCNHVPQCGCDVCNYVAQCGCANGCNENFTAQCGCS